MISKPAVFLVLLFCAAPVCAFVDPDGFAGLKWFASEADAGKQFQLFGDPVDKGRERDRKAWVTIGEMTIGADLTFLDGKFVHIFLKIEANYLDAFSHALIARYGKPTAAAGKTVIWQGKSVTMLFNKMLVQIGAETFATATVSHNRYAEYLAALKRKNAERAAKDL